MVSRKPDDTSDSTETKERDSARMDNDSQLRAVPYSARRASAGGPGRVLEPMPTNIALAVDVIAISRLKD
jgi:hypothetical protein